MSLFGSLGEILSGRRLHKNTTNNVVVSELWTRCETLPYEHQERFRDFVVAASSVAEMFFFADNHPKEIHAKSYTIEQFRQFYDAVVTLFVHLHCLANPDCASQLIACLKFVAANIQRAEKLLLRLRKYSEVNNVLVGEAYSHVMEEASIGNPTFESFTVFTSGCLAAYNSVVPRTP